MVAAEVDLFDVYKLFEIGTVSFICVFYANASALVNVTTLCNPFGTFQVLAGKPTRFTVLGFGNVAVLGTS